jgi:cytochrome d ubiquinol oxidase subunit I
MPGCSTPSLTACLPNGSYEVTSFWGLLTNPWACFSTRTICQGAVVTAAFVMCAVGAFYVLENRFAEHGKIFLRVGVTAGVIACVTQIFPTGDLHGRYMAKHQPAAVAAWKACSVRRKARPSCSWASRMKKTQTIDNPIVVNDVLSFLIYGTTRAEVKAWTRFLATSGLRRCLFFFTATTSWRGWALTSF